MMNRKPNSSSQSGFTLIETMITMVVFLIAVFGMVSLQRASIEGAEKGQEHSAATNLGRFFLTQLKNEISGWRALAPNVPRDSDNLFDGSAGFQLLTADVIQNQEWTTLDGTGGLKLDAYLGHSELEEDGVKNSAARFCVEYRVEPMDHPEDIWSSPPTLAERADLMVWKVRVRVLWPKRNQFDFWKNDNACSSDNVDSWLASDTPPDLVELVAVATRELAQ